MTGCRFLLASTRDDSIEQLETSLTRLFSSDQDSAVILGVAPSLSDSIVNPGVASSAKRAEQETLDQLNQKLSSLKSRFTCPADIDLASGDIATETIDAAVLRQADIVVKIADGAGQQSSPLLGSVDKKLIRRCPAPTLILRQPLGHTPKIVVAVDNPDKATKPEDAYLMSAELLKRSVDLAVRLGVEDITILHLGWIDGISYLTGPWSQMTKEAVEATIAEYNDTLSAWLEGVAQRATAKYAETGVRFTPHLEMGYGGKALANAADAIKADILVIGSANRRGLQGLFFGNTAEGVIDHTKSALYVVKPGDFRSMI